MRRWRQFEPREIGGYVVTMYGPTGHARRGMLCFCDDVSYLPAEVDPRDGAAVLCTPALTGKVALRGHMPITCDSPRDRFFELFKELPFHEVTLDIQGDLARTSVVGGRAFKIHNDRLLANHGGVYVGRGATVGESTCIDAGVYGEFTEIHELAHIDNKVHIGHSAVIERRAQIAASSVVGGWAIIGAGCRIGIGAAIRDNISVGRGARVGMGAVVVADVPEYAEVRGCPARITGWLKEK